MKRLYTDFTYDLDGFVGHMAEPEKKARQAVIIIMGGEKGILPGIKIAERFTDFGIAGLSVSLFGAKGLPKGPDRIPVDMFEAAVRYLRKTKGYTSVSVYGISMGSIVAAFVACHISGIDNLIMVSPSHVPFEGVLDKKHMTGHSFVTWRGEEIPFIKPDFSTRKASKYLYDSRAERLVMGMWSCYMDAYEDKALEERAILHLEESGSRILMIAGEGDEAWPSDYSVRYLQKHLDRIGYANEYKTIIYPYASHLLGVMPNQKREKWLYRMLPMIGLVYRSIGKHKKECMEALRQSEKEIIDWIRNF